MSKKLDQHDLVSSLTQIALELGRTPTVDEFLSKSEVSKADIRRVFSSYPILVQAAGLESPIKVESVSVTNDIFKVDIERHLEAFRLKQEARPYSKPIFPSLACISDIHFPFHSQRVLDRFFRYCGDIKPKNIILAGDAWDMYSHAKFPRSHNLFTPIEEEAIARKLNEEFWREIKRQSPDSVCTQLLGNHDVRPLKRIMDHVPTMEHWIQEKFSQIFSFEGVETIFDPRQELFLEGDTMIHHGYRSKLGDHRDYALLNAICGHTHRPGVVWRKIRNGQLYEMNCGLAGDPAAKGLSYTSQKITDWVNAFGVVDEDGPRNVVV